MTRTSLPHYPSFGSCIQELQYAFSVAGDTSKYRFGFNGEESESDISGNGMVYDLGERFYDGRLGRMFSIDPLYFFYSWQSPYAYCRNSPTSQVDYKGLGDPVKGDKVKKGEGLASYMKRNGMDYYNSNDRDKIAKLNPDIFPNGIKKGSYMLHEGMQLNVGELELSADYYNALKYSITKSKHPWRRPSIPAFNYGDFSIRGSDVIGSNIFTERDKASILNEFSINSGPTKSVFLDDHKLTYQLSQGYGFQNMKYLVYSKVSKLYNRDFSLASKNSANNCIYSKFVFDFTPNLFYSMNYSAEQFVGSWVGFTFLSNDKKSLIFVICDVKSSNSFFLHVPNSKDRNSSRFWGNSFQKYIWSEKIDWNWYYKQYRDDKSGEPLRDDTNLIH